MDMFTSYGHIKINHRFFQTVIKSKTMLTPYGVCDIVYVDEDLEFGEL